MNLGILLILGAMAAPAQMADFQIAESLETIQGSPASIEVVGLKPAPLVESTDKNGWVKVPAKLAHAGVNIYMPAKGTGSAGGSTANGIADITITGDGYLLLACNYDNQGNASGDWKKEAWSEQDFQAKGWQELSKSELGGLLIDGANHAQIIFAKLVHQGENYRLRCNKYYPPYPIILGAVKSTTAPPAIATQPAQKK